MGFKTFKGGILLNNQKNLTKDLKTKEFSPKNILIFPMLMHKGESATPIVAMNEHVLKGQVIGTLDHEKTNIHASISGKVIDIKDYETLEHEIVPAVYIENDYKYEEIKYQETKDYKALTKNEILEKIKKAGVVGMSGSGTPTYEKLTRQAEHKIEYVIINAIECEPYITCDYRMLMEEKSKIEIGLDILFHLYEHAQGIIAFSSENLECAQKYMSETSRRLEEQQQEQAAKPTEQVTNPKEQVTNQKKERVIQVEILESKYPQGSERQLIATLTGRKFSSKQFGTDVGVVVLNVHTVMAIYEAVILGKPVMNRRITISGNGVKDPGNYYVPIGTPIKDLIATCQPFKESIQIVGGAMMGQVTNTNDLSITKITSAILCLKQTKKAKVTECIRCARCVEVCPQSLVPMKLWEFGKNNKMSSFLKWNGTECISCGSCSYICPAKIDLTHIITQMKKTCLKTATEEQKSKLAQQEEQDSILDKDYPKIPEIIKKEEVD